MTTLLSLLLVTYASATNAQFVQASHKQPCSKMPDCIGCCMDMPKAFIESPENVNKIHEACKRKLQDRESISKVLRSVSYDDTKFPAIVHAIYLNTNVGIEYFNWLCQNGIARQKCVKTCPMGK